MPQLNKTSLLLGLVWVIVSFTLAQTVLEEWLFSMNLIVIPLIIVAPVLLIRILFDYILKYDFFNKNYKKDRKQRK
ncbi:hypothetical protein ACFOLA_04385 [Salinicoccus hispanicus]|uniref:Uncharacterized protein n=1 Tax=Salinicoccus hispanicus TaxID=157225 RepID=A0A6N8U2T5_9STAP|nr:hypothetical protein [Salinicoccus hispanicus]MXQ52053.1 hypothetical protein [Salinicoccus hispanicus]